MSIPTSFNGTCVRIQYPCTTGERFVDPCDCKFYYLCRDSLSIIRQACAPGTAYDHTSATAYCNRFQTVILKGLCTETEPWRRCGQDHQNVDYGKLERWCAGSGYFTEAPRKQKEDDGGNAGAIAAAIISLLLVVAVVALLIVYVRKKGNPIKHIKQTKFWQNFIQREDNAYDNTSNDNSQQSTPRYADAPTASAPGDEDAYTEIDDAAMYKDSKRIRRHSSRASFAANGNDDQTHHKEMEAAMAASASMASARIRRSASRNSFADVAIDEEEHIHREELAAALAASEAEAEAGKADAAMALGAYDNPGLEMSDEGEAPPPDTQNHPAPPAYYSGRRPSQKEVFIEMAELDHHHDHDHEPSPAAAPAAEPYEGDDGYLVAAESVAGSGARSRHASTGSARVDSGARSRHASTGSARVESGARSRHASTGSARVESETPYYELERENGEYLDTSFVA